MGQQAVELLSLSFIATAVVTAYRGVDDNGVQIATQGAMCAGIAKRPAAIGDAFEAAAIGTATCEAGAPITKGQFLQMDNVGRVIPATAAAIAAGATAVTSTAANGAIISGGYLPQAVIGRALEAAAAAGDFIEVFLSI